MQMTVLPKTPATSSTPVAFRYGLTLTKTANSFTMTPSMKPCATRRSSLLRTIELVPRRWYTVATFDVAEDPITLDFVWEIDMDNYYYRYFGSDDEPFEPSQQSIHALYCPPEQANDDGSCTEEADLMCVRAVPYSGCDGYSYPVSNDHLIEAAYRTLWSASGSEAGSPENIRSHRRLFGSGGSG